MFPCLNPVCFCIHALGQMFIKSEAYEVTMTTQLPTLYLLL